LDELANILLHPSRWATDLKDVNPLTRLYLAGVIFGFTVLIAFVAGGLTSRWAHRRATDEITEHHERTIVRLRRYLIAVMIFVGTYFAIQMAPLGGRSARWLTGLTFVLGAFACARAVIHLVSVLLASSVTAVGPPERTRLEREYVPLAEKLTTLAVMLILFIVIAKHFGQDVTSLVAALGVGSLAIGLAAQQTLGNMIAGFTILADRPFRPGDRIRLATGETGDVQNIGVRSTRIVLADSNLLVVPNTELANSRVVNYALPTRATRGEVRVTVVYGSDVDRATRILGELAAADERIAKTPEPTVRVMALGELGIELMLTFHAASKVDAATVEEKLRRGVLERFPAEKLQIGYKSSQGVPSGSPV
jgi:small-conductance mechanosensitive channel